MTKENVLLFIKNWLDEHKPQSNFKLFKILKDDIDKWNFIENYNKEFNIKSDIEKIYRFYYQVYDELYCSCGKTLPFSSFQNGYKTSCSRSCATKLKWSSGIMNKSLKDRGETFKQRWGKNSENHKDILDKRKNTSIEKYGADHHMKSIDFYNNYKKSIFEKYGEDNVAKIDAVKNKIKETWKNKDNLSKIVKDRSIKHKKSLLKKYGVLNLISIPGVKDKIIKHNLENRGVEYNFQSKDIFEKSKSTCLLKYGFENAMQNKDIQEKCFKASVKLKDYIFKSGRTVKYQGDLNFALDEILKSYDEDDILVEFECNSIEYELNNNKHYYRPDIYIKSKNKIIEVKSFYTFYIDLDKNIAKMKSCINQGYNFEFWIYSHQKDLYIFNFEQNNFLNNLDEYDYIYGDDIIFFYNERKIFKFLKEDDYPKNKLKNLKYNLSLKNNNIDIIFIFNDLIENKYEVILSRMLNKIGLSNKIYARNCDIRIIDNKETRNFLINNHIQGFLQSKINIGLYYNNELVSIMTFGKRRVALGNKKTNENEFELLRFCNKINYTVIGGASKLLKYFIKNYNPKSILTFADKNWSNGNLYEKLNFKFIEETIPNYWYIKNGKRYHRYNFRKDILVKEGFDKNKTEHQIMNERGYKRIYDCGNIKYEILL